MGPRLLCCLMLLALGLVAPSGSARAMPLLATKSFDVSLASGTRSTQFELPRIGEAGCIIAQIASWSGNTSLTLTIKGGSRSSQAVSASQGPLWVSYPVSKDQASQRWIVEASRGTGRETLRGRLVVEYPPTQVPCGFQAATSGRNVTLTWSYNGPSFKGSFVVERSSDLRSWQAVYTKTSGQGSFSYNDRVSRAGTYWYRACAVGRGSRCGSSNVTPPFRASVR